MRSLLLQIFAIYSIRALENPIPASYLQPRNFNPHPYQREGKAFLIAPVDYDYQNLEAERNLKELSRRFQKFVQQIQNYLQSLTNIHNFRTGPIQFPENFDDPQTQQQQLEQQRKVVSHIVEKQALIPNPYEKLALNYRSQQLQRFSGNVRTLFDLKET